MAHQLSSLRSTIRQRLGWAATDQFVVDSELTGYINDSLVELHSLLASINKPGEWGVTSEGISTVAGTPGYQLSGAMGRMVAVRFLFGDRLYPMERFNPTTEVLVLTARGWSPGVPRYALNKQGGLAGFADGNCEITFNPPPAAIYTVLATYVQAAPVLVADGDTSWLGADEYVILDVMIKCLQKEEDDFSGPARQKEAFIERLKQQSTPVDQGMPSTVADGRGVNSGRDIAESWFWR